MERVKKIRDYAFVHFSHREDAINAMKALNGKVSHLYQMGVKYILLYFIVTHSYSVILIYLSEQSHLFLL